MADLELSATMKGAESIERASRQMRNLKENAVAADRQIGVTARTTAPQLSSTLAGAAARSQSLLGSFNSMAGAIGLSVSALSAMRLIMSDLEQKAERLKTGFQGIFGDVNAEARLIGLEKVGLAPEGSIDKLTKMRESFAARGLSRTTGEYLQAGAEVAAVTGMRKEDMLDAVRMAMEIWARGGFQGSFSGAASNLARVLQTGQTRMLAQYGIAIDETQFEGMDTEERTRAVYEAMAKQLKGESYLDRALASKDPRMKALIASISAGSEKDEAVQREATGELARKLALENFRKTLAAQGINPDAVLFGGGGMGQIGFWATKKELDPESTIIGALLRWLTRVGESVGMKTDDLARQYLEDARRELSINTNPAETKR